ncbi:hypothetical protein BCV69DRAFT_312475 [Microstroma glucosiphilum]|uniref:Uncharacterized protein n=1 Tax=Pseudomicrostroma glucosiphilum TaxID=1684307 RepID=A0A316U7L5_9BASI|nr:hypothetical protein BCV69DRAFT_312475 [Pseudomicrostroma glucosiphilum]PWN21230.1 hypothetical protein BCV69DRAFT_312475 [Pseudomicrostroma glucosiphilum]
MSARAPRPSVDGPALRRATRSRASTSAAALAGLATQETLLQRIELLENTAAINLRRHAADSQAVKDRAAAAVKRAKEEQREAEEQASAWKQQAEEFKARAENLESKLAELVRRAREGQVDAQCRFAAIEQIAVDANWRPQGKKRARQDDEDAAGPSTQKQSRVQGLLPFLARAYDFSWRLTPECSQRCCLAMKADIICSRTGPLLTQILCIFSAIWAWNSSSSGPSRPSRGNRGQPVTEYYTKTFVRETNNNEGASGSGRPGTGS